MYNNMSGYGLWRVLCCLGLMATAGCTSLGKGGMPSFSFMNTYEAALKDFERGRIMEARARVLAIRKDHEDYAKARRLLNTKIDPARLRLVRHYRLKGEEAEARGEWFRAMRFYDQATTFSIKPEIFAKRREAMNLKMRQVRMQALITERRLEDAAWLSGLDAYEPPRGVDPRDTVFLRMRETYQDDIEDRATRSYREARRYLRNDLPEIAYIEIESHLRLEPDSDRGKRLRAEILKAIPKGIHIPAYTRPKGKPATVVKHVPVPKSVTTKQVHELMRKGEWLKARKYALVYRREGGKDADRLLKQIQANIEKKAASLFDKGRLAFRREHLDEAVKYWAAAVELMPAHPEYVEALRRGQQLQERLRILRESEAAEPKKE